MVSLVSLTVVAALVAGAALLVARWRGLPPKTALADAAAACLGTLAALAAAAALYALPDGRHGGAWALLAAPVVASSVLRARGRRGTLRALLVSGLALAAVVAWLTLQLRGPRAWTIIEAATVAPIAAVAVGAAACLGAWTKRSARASAALLLVFTVACAEGDRGTLRLDVVDAASGRPTPARVELLAADGSAVVPDGALPIYGDCGAAPLHNWLPWTAGLQALRNRRHAIDDPYRGTRQFYVDGSIATELLPGRYRVRAFKGLEHRVAGGEVVVENGASERLELRLERWIDLPAAGWYGADDHLHIPRPSPRFDAAIATWMRAEDLHVANLLQMGLARDVHITPQHAFGPVSVFRQGDTLVVSGQENPRTHVLGHSIVLGAREWIDIPASYPLYDLVWREALAQGGVNGLAHWAAAGAEEALALWGADELVDFIEVLNLGLPFYERWYEALNLGLRIGPTAGTDYPCLPSLPGRERFYAHLDGPLDYEEWLHAVRRGRTFVTNGPVVELDVGGAGIGETLRLDGASTVRVSGRVRFDPQRDDVRRLELIRAGELVRSVSEPVTPGRIELDASIEIERSTWLALRASGVKRGETEVDLRSTLESMLVLERQTNAALLDGLPEEPTPRPSAAHTGAVWVEVAGTPPLAEQPAARRVVAAWLDRLDELEARFADERIEATGGFPGRGDGIDAAELRAHRAALLQAIERARAAYLRLE